MKKVLSLVLAVMMVLSSMSFAFAGTFEDVKDATTAKAVDALSSLGVVNGNPDGTYKPEAAITRAEIAKLLVVALGHGDLAEGSKSSFKDAQGKWYEGFTAVAQSACITDGYPDGTFKGENSVTYQEAIVMLLRSLGYTNQTVNSNRADAYNAVSYKTVASRLGLLKNVTFKAGNANRGDVAVMIYNALEVPMVVTGEKGNPVEVVLADGTKELLLDKVATKGNAVITTSDLFGANVADVSAYLGEEVVAYYNNDGEIVFVKSSADAAAKRVVSGTINATSTSANTFKVKKADKTTVTYDVTGSAITFTVNNVSTTKTGAEAVAQLAEIAKRVHTIKVVAANSKVTDDKMEIVVEDVNQTIQANAAFIAGKTKFQGIALPTKDGSVNAAKLVFVGDASALEDIQANDVVQACIGYNSNGSSNNIKFYVTRNTVEGEVTETNSDGGHIIAETEYYLNGTGNTITSLALGAKGMFFLDKDGKIAFAKADETTTTSNYGIITAYNTGRVGQSFGKWSATKSPQVKMVGADGKEKIYDVVVKVNAADGTTASATGFNVKVASTVIDIEANVGDKIMQGTTDTNEILVKYALNEDGKITKIEDVNLSDYTTAKKSDAKFLANNTTVVLSRNASGEYSLVSLDKLTTATIGYQVISNAANFKWDFVVITTGVESANQIKTYAVITSISNVKTSDGTVQKLTAYVDGVKVTYIANSSSLKFESDISKVIALTFDVKGNVSGKDTVNLLSSGVVTASAINSDNSRIKVINDKGNEELFTLATDVVIYKLNSNGSISLADLNDIRITDGTAKIEMYTKNTSDGVVNVILIK